MTYSYIVQIVAVAQVEVANEVAAVVLWITVGRLHTHWTHLENAREHTQNLDAFSVSDTIAVSNTESFIWGC